MRTRGWYGALITANDTYLWKSLIGNKYQNNNRKSLFNLGDIEVDAGKMISSKTLELTEYIIDDEELNILYSLFCKVFPPKFRRPLFIHIFCIGWSDNRENWQKNLDVESVLEWIIKREENRWERILASQFGSDNIHDYLCSWKEVFTYAALFGKISIFEHKYTPFQISIHIDKFNNAIAGTRMDMDSKTKIQAFYAELLGSETIGIGNIEILWPDIIIEHMFYNFFDRSLENIQFYRQTISALGDSKQAVGFLERMQNDGLFDKDIAQILGNENIIEMAQSGSSSVQVGNISGDITIVLDNNVNSVPETNQFQFNAFPKPLNASDEARLFEQMAKGDTEVRNTIIERNLRLVASVAKKFGVGNNMENVDDLISVGTIGLIKATDSYNSERGTRFATYATQCIQNEILMYMRSSKKNAKDNYLFNDGLQERNMRFWVAHELSHIAMFETDYLSDIVDQDADVHNIIQSKEFLALLNDAMNVLTERERVLITLRYGLGNAKPLSQNEVAAHLGVSRSYVSRIEKKALESIRKYLDQK